MLFRSVASPATIKKEKKERKKQKKAAAKADKAEEAQSALAASMPPEKSTNWCWFYNSKLRGGPKDCKWGSNCRRDHVRVPDATFNAAPVPGSRPASPAPPKRSGSPPPDKPGGKGRGKGDGQESGKGKGKGKDNRPQFTFEEKRIYYADPKNFRTENGKKTVFYCAAFLNTKCEREKCFFPHRNKAKIDQLNAVLNA